ncbi:acyl-CoA carboxylase subunit epsilon [Nocardioides terrisoli]|uniref:acyl-CoA carboxylase subunit epsilon n=1 Tax=Nocardioides terrisoli TaxID=3388267 RepID=UPI00287B6C9C|nr:acyl-CoA carboxylase subunit epsilon [Nocardioides marmorisolisilvae]
MSEVDGVPAEQPPLLRVLTPGTTAEEVAALVAVLSAMGSDAPEPPRRTSAWSDPRRRLTPSYPHGPGGWHASGLPR